MPRPSSNLRVFVAFKDDTVFAGEDVECTITFKNVDYSSPPPNGAATKDGNGFPRSLDPLQHLRAARGPSHTPLTRNLSLDSQAAASAVQNRPSHNRNTSSLSIVESAGPQHPSELPGGGYHIADAGPERRHARRVSIVSLGASAALQRPKHARSATVQASSNVRPPKGPSEPIATHTNQNERTTPSPSPVSPSPLSASSTPPLMRPSHSRAASVQISERWLADVRDQPPDQESRDSPKVMPKSNMASSPQDDSPAAPSSTFPFRSQLPKSPSPQLQNEQKPPDRAERPKSPVKVFSAKSLEGTPRSSVDIYSTSNHSNETLVSEYPAQPSSRLLQTAQLNRTISHTGRPEPARLTESLMMGYAQLSGSFSLDGSLVNSAPFEEIKRKAVVGGQAGGGVVGITQPSGDGGLFGAFNWSNIGSSIGESFGGFMGGSNLSSIKEMKGIADSNAIPLLSTSKSILFVDLKLAPGQSKSYSYRFTLPRGLPPSHKGRAIKVTYSLVIGVQRSGSARSSRQQIKQVEVPFRVFGGVNTDGESLGHDLMAPYIILKDQAHTAPLDGATTEAAAGPERDKLPEKSTSSAADFQSYVNRLLTRPRHDSVSGLLSPTADNAETPITPKLPQFNSSPEYIPSPVKARAMIDRAIFECTNPASSQHIPTNFTIARSSIPIASLSLSKSALKLGDIITCIIDFSGAKLPCYAFEATLESSEKIDSTLAIRSPQSVERATRRVWARTVENALWARRCAFRAQVPVNATPAFATTGVGLDWFIRLELVIGYGTEAEQNLGEVPEEQEQEQEQEAQAWAAPQKAEQLLEVISTDERGTVLGAMQRLACHSFEVTIPLRVFGAVAGGGEKSSVDDSQGLAV